jgi:hypothetical protein
MPAEKRPSLTREKVLIIHDRDAGVQHFVREVAFKRATEPFGFVVPTPTRPSVDSVKKQPFSKLRETFPFARLEGGLRGMGGGAPGSGAADGEGGVQILEVKKVGSFIAFVLAATDEKALSRWLADNDLVSTPEADQWLAHYVKMGFFYVAMRYDPGKKDDVFRSSVEAETMRISFATPVPYYPYLEPESKFLTEQPRLMELWYVGRDKVQPVALRDKDGTATWVRPLQPGLVTDEAARDELLPTLSPPLTKLLPKGDLVVQTFQDQKFWRTGFGDILFAFEEAQTLDDAQLAALEPMLGILDPALAGATKEAE